MRLYYAQTTPLVEIEVQLEFAAADGRFDAGGSEVPLGLEAEVVVNEPATGRCK